MFLLLKPNELPGFTVASPILCYITVLLLLSVTGFTLLLDPAQGQSGEVPLSASEVVLSMFGVTVGGSVLVKSYMAACI